MGMMVTMSLETEHGWGADRVPWVQLVNALVDTVLVLLTREAVVLDVVDCLKVERSHKGVQELVLEGVPSEDEVNCGHNWKVEKLVVGHFVVNHLEDEGNSITIFFLNSSALTIPEVNGLSYDSSWQEHEGGLIQTGWTGVIGSCHSFMVALYMLVEEVWVKELCVSPVAEVLVVPLLSMHHLVALNSVEAGKEAPGEGEYKRI